MLAENSLRSSAAPPREVGPSVAEAAFEQALVDGSIAQWTADAARLADDIGRVFRDLHWGRLSVEPTARMGNEPQGTSEAGKVSIQARALLPDGRTATVAARAVGDGQVRVAVRVGQFGDGPLEQRFVDALVKRLSGKPKRQRGGKFEVP